MRLGSETQPSLGTRGRGSPAGAEPQPGLLTRCTGRRSCDLSVLLPGSVREASPKVKSQPFLPAVEVGGPTPLGAGIGNAWLPRACRPGVAIAGLPEVGVSPVVKKESREMIKPIFPLLALVSFYCDVVASYFIFRWFNDKETAVEELGRFSAGWLHPTPSQVVTATCHFFLPAATLDSPDSWSPLCWVPGSSSNAPPTKALHTHFLLVRQQRKTRNVVSAVPAHSGGSLTLEQKRVKRL